MAPRRSVASRRLSETHAIPAPIGLALLLCWLACVSFASADLRAENDPGASEAAESPFAVDPFESPAAPVTAVAEPTDKSEHKQLLQAYSNPETVGRPPVVRSALKWLETHQLPDGGWSFDHTQAPKCKRQCGNPGDLAEARNAATGLALLCFLGAGHTHTAGRHQDTVKAGLDFLVERMKIGEQGGSLYEPGGRMYSHGIATIALCEAYAMTGDKALQRPAQQAIDFIAHAQDPVGGGWRYQPRQRGDTSVTGWQVTALKSGQMAYLRVPPVTVHKAFTFLDSVQANDGAHYGYTEPTSDRECTTAIGLLLRMHLGWKRDNPALKRGVAWLSEQGPSKTNMDYNYHATQVMRHFGGDAWDKWNAPMRDYLVSTQSQEGHQKGSWFFEGDDLGASRGGRLYCTAMATMILEVYYRHLPIYRKVTPEEESPATKPDSTENGPVPIPGLTPEEEPPTAKP